eukprot:TRINITY_DN6818_c0_g1_i2.p1 TRINITY_DN6818_c0_g1~~TRINITY_DN6818_c0_g1_i2.p1  ORF type:complete len:333 (+),score=72.94 TRINITY_DN6818_c0_g1_i2:28-999(+)
MASLRALRCVASACARPTLQTNSISRISAFPSCAQFVQSNRSYAKKSSSKPSKKKQKLAQLREQRLSERKEQIEGPKEEVVIDFSPKVQNCDLMTALAREEMHYRRLSTPFPEFYPGSIIAVNYRDNMSQAKPSRQVGIVIAKRNKGLGSNFILRNSENGVGFELRFNSYSPLIESIEVLQLARRRRAKLYYLRDRPAKESYVNPRFSAPAHDPTQPIPVIKANPNRKKPVNYNRGKRIITRRGIKKQLKQQLKSITKPERYHLSKREQQAVRAGKLKLPAPEDRPQTLLSNPEIRHVLKRKVRRMYKQQKQQLKQKDAESEK